MKLSENTIKAMLASGITYQTIQANMEAGKYEISRRVLEDARVTLEKTLARAEIAAQMLALLDGEKAAKIIEALNNARETLATESERKSA